MTVAEKILKPKKGGIFRTVFLYTGQGETTLLIIPTGSGVDDYIYVLLDSDLDKDPKEVNLIKLFKDLFATRGELSIFINTHPHDDHLGGIKEIYKEIGFKEVWHSNHKPGKEKGDSFKDFTDVLKKLGKKNEFHLKGTNDSNKIRTTDDKEVIKKLGNVDYIVLSPAEYLCDEIDDEDAEARYHRIHEQCGVIKFTYGKDAKSILFTGDSDKEAWQSHITDYHKKNLSAMVLSASHHGSHTFFKVDEEDEDVYLDHIKAINPTYLIISAPKQEDSPHGHPHDDAMKLYKKYIDEDGIYHLGSGPYSVIVDIDDKGNLSIDTDTELIEAYADDGDDDGGGEKDKNLSKSAPFIVPSTTRIDHKPMGAL